MINFLYFMPIVSIPGCENYSFFDIYAVTILKVQNPICLIRQCFSLSPTLKQQLRVSILEIVSMDSYCQPVMAVIRSNPQSRQNLILLKQNSLPPVPRCLLTADTIISAALLSCFLFFHSDRLINI